MALASSQMLIFAGRVKSLTPVKYLSFTVLAKKCNHQKASLAAFYALSPAFSGQMTTAYKRNPITTGNLIGCPCTEAQS